ncbi:MAG: FtsX-like permease family protein [Actinomycetaceae bacterium]|nr:FtsX-like permease family protein [Actinomycetaceae bacterium]
MNPIRPLIKRQVRQHRALMITVLLLAILAGGLGNLGIIFAYDYPRDFQTKLDELGTEHLQVGAFNLLTPDIAVDFLDNDSRVNTVTTQEIFGNITNFTYNGEDNAASAIFVDIGEETSLGQPRIVSELASPAENPIYVPLMLHSGGGYELGDTFVLYVGEKPFSFHIQGFTENVFNGSLAMGTFIYGLPSEDYAALRDNPTFEHGWLIRAQLTDVANAADILADVSSHLEESAYEHGVHLGNGWIMDLGIVLRALTIGSSVYSAILVALSILLIAVTALISVVTIRNAIRDDITAIGMQRALGYTTPQIGTAIVLPLAGFGLFGAGLGVALSYLLLGSLAQSMTAQTGIEWLPGFSLAGLTVLPVIGLLYALAGFAGTWAIRRISAVTALRGGITSHTFRRNRLPLATTRGSLTTTLGIKSALKNVGQGLSMTIIIATSAFAILFGIAAYWGFFADEDTFAETMMPGRVSDIKVQLDIGADSADIREQLASVNGVDLVLPLEIVDGTVNGVRVRLNITDDFADLPTENSIIYEGREPFHDNEIALGGVVAERLGVDIGDTVTFKFRGVSTDLLVTGLLQTVQFVGMSADITFDALFELRPDFDIINFSVWIAPDAHLDDILATYRGIPGVYLAEDMRTAVHSQADVYRVMIQTLLIAILTLTAVTITLITAMSATTVVSRSRHSMGISKALGFTSNQLIAQLALSYLPSVILGAGVGLIISAVGVNTMLSAILRNVGMLKLNIAVPWSLYAAVGIGMVVLAVTMIFLSGLRIRKISPYQLLAV